MTAPLRLDAFDTDYALIASLHGAEARGARFIVVGGSGARIPAELALMYLLEGRAVLPVLPSAQRIICTCRAMPRDLADRPDMRRAAAELCILHAPVSEGSVFAAAVRHETREAERGREVGR